MAEEKILFEVEIDPAILAQSKQAVGGLNAELVTLGETRKALSKQMRENDKAITELTASEGANSTQVARLKQEQKELGKELAAVQREQKKGRAELNLHNKTISAATNSIDGLKARNSQLYKEMGRVNIATEEGRKKLDAMAKEYAKNRKQITDFDKSLGLHQGNVGNYPKILTKVNTGLDGFQGKLAESQSPLARMTGGIISATRAAVAFIATPLGAALAIISGALAAVKLAFTSSEEGQNRYNKLMGMLGVIVGNVGDIVADFGEFLIDAFSNPRESLEKLGDLIKENIENRINGMLELLPALGRAMKLAFSGEFTEAFKVAGDAVGKVVTGVDGLSDKIGDAVEGTKEFVKEQAREVALAGKVADLRAKADKLDRALITERVKAQTQLNELRTKARDEELFTAKERKAFLDEAVAIQNDLLNKESELTKIRYEAQRIENTFSKTNKENKEKEAQAEADVLKVEQQRAALQLTLSREYRKINNDIKKEEAAINKLIEDRIQLEGDVLQAKQKQLDSETPEDLEESPRIKQLAAEATRELEIARETEAEKQRLFQTGIENGINAANDFLNYQQAAADISLAILRGRLERGEITEEEFQRKAEKRAKRTFKIQKAVNLGIAIIGGVVSAINSLKNNGGVPLGLPAMFTSIGITAAQIGSIASQPPPQFADGGNLSTDADGVVPAYGGMIRGRSHAQGGVRFVMPNRSIGEADGRKGEAYIVNTNNDPVLRSMASRLNVAGGGRPFDYTSNYTQANGAINGFRMFAEGGAMNSTGAPSVGVGVGLEAVVAAIANAPRPVVAVQDIIGEVDRRVSVEDAANL